MTVSLLQRTVMRHIQQVLLATPPPCSVVQSNSSPCTLVIHPHLDIPHTRTRPELKGLTSLQFRVFPSLGRMHSVCSRKLGCLQFQTPDHCPAHRVSGKSSLSTTVSLCRLKGRMVPNISQCSQRHCDAHMEHDGCHSRAYQRRSGHHWKSPGW